MEEDAAFMNLMFNFTAFIIKDAIDSKQIKQILILSLLLCFIYPSNGLILSNYNIFITLFLLEFQKTTATFHKC